MKPDNNSIEILLPDVDQDFTFITDAKMPVQKAKIMGSADNEAFYKYMQLLGSLRPEADTLSSQMKQVRGNVNDSLRLAKQLLDVDKRVKKMQQDIFTKIPNSLTERIIKSTMDVELPKTPDMEGTDEAAQLRRYYWFREHYFDNLNIDDVCMLRGPVLHGKVDYYIQKLTPQHPDSINKALDVVLGKMKPTGENFRYFLIHFLNFYAQSQYVGMDACYVHLAKNYYCKKEYASWADKKSLEITCDNARRLDPILIGKVAPELLVKQPDGTIFSLHGLDSEYTVLVFWDPECGICKKAAPFIVDFNKKYKDKGIKVVAFCTAKYEKASECAKSVQEKEFNDLINLMFKPPKYRDKFTDHQTVNLQYEKKNMDIRREVVDS
jgi:thiol-disulfide isomerase/thioredoxin